MAASLRRLATTRSPTPLLTTSQSSTVRWFTPAWVRDGAQPRRQHWVPRRPVRPARRRRWAAAGAAAAAAAAAAAFAAAPGGVSAAQQQQASASGFVKVSGRPIAALAALDLDYFAALDADVLCIESSPILDDMGEAAEHTMPIREFIRELRRGSKLYLKYDDCPDSTAFKLLLPELGALVQRELHEHLRSQNQLPVRLMADERCVFTWTLWVGGRHTETAMHCDDDDFHFLYVIHGRKRVVLLPAVCQFPCRWVHGSCWPGIDILNGPLPPQATEVTLGAGEGIIISPYCWHAVRNLEPCIAVGYAINGEEDGDDDERGRQPRMNVARG